MTIVSEDYRLNLTKPLYVPPCAFTALDAGPDVDWIGHPETRPAAWLVELFAPPAISKPSRVFVCDRCKQTLTGELFQALTDQMAPPGTYARVIRRLG